MRWLDKLADAVAERLLQPMIGAIAVAVNESHKHAIAASEAAQSSRRAMGVSVAAREAVIDAENRLLLSLTAAREFAGDTAELRKLIRMVMLAGEQLKSRAASIEQIEKAIMRRLDIRLRVIDRVVQEAQAADVAERLRLNEQAEKWRKLAMSRIEAELDAQPPTTTISGL